MRPAGTSREPWGACQCDQRTALVHELNHAQRSGPKELRRRKQHPPVWSLMICNMPCSAHTVGVGKVPAPAAGRWLWKVGPSRMTFKFFDFFSFFFFFFFKMCFFLFAEFRFWKSLEFFGFLRTFCSNVFFRFFGLVSCSVYPLRSLPLLGRLFPPTRGLGGATPCHNVKHS